MSAPVYQILASDAGLSALVGTNIFPEIIPQETLSRPVVIYRTITGNAVNVQSGNATADYERVQLDIIGLTAANVDAVFTAMRAALENIPALKALNTATVLSNFNGVGYEPDTKEYKSSTDWDFFTLR